MMRRLRQAWERLTIYLPIALMGLLALGSWWLVRNAPAPLTPTPARPALHEPDYTMRDFSVKSFDAAGRLHSEVRGALARHYADTDTLEIDQARMRAVTPDGRVSTASANRAVTNADGSEVELFGNAIVTREPVERAGQAPQPRMEFRGEFLHAWMNDERVSSNRPVTLTHGADTFTADSMEYNHLDQTLRLQGRVRGMLMPQSRHP
jgi:lipopolysaccharide export system protein LptC